MCISTVHMARLERRTPWNNERISLQINLRRINPSFGGKYTQCSRDPHGGPTRSVCEAVVNHTVITHWRFDSCLEPTAFSPEIVWLRALRASATPICKHFCGELYTPQSPDRQPNFNVPSALWRNTAPARRTVSNHRGYAIIFRPSAGIARPARTSPCTPFRLSEPWRPQRACNVHCSKR